MKIKTVLTNGILLIAAVLAMFIGNNLYQSANSYHESSQSIAFSIPDYEGLPYVEINQNVPFFDSEDYTTESFEIYRANGICLIRREYLGD